MFSKKDIVGRAIAASASLAKAKYVQLPSGCNSRNSRYSIASAILSFIHWLTRALETRVILMKKEAHFCLKCYPYFASHVHGNTAVRLILYSKYYFALEYPYAYVSRY